MIICGEYGVKQPNNTYVCVMFCGVVSYVSFGVVCVYCGTCVWCGEVWSGMAMCDGVVRWSCLWCGVVWCDVVRCCICVRYGVVYLCGVVCV